MFLLGIDMLPDLFNIYVKDLPEDIHDKLYDLFFETTEYCDFNDLLVKELDGYLYCYTSADYFNGYQLTFYTEAHYTWFLLKWM